VARPHIVTPPKTAAHSLTARTRRTANPPTYLKRQKRSSQDYLNAANTVNMRNVDGNVNSFLIQIDSRLEDVRNQLWYGIPAATDSVEDDIVEANRIRGIIGLGNWFGSKNECLQSSFTTSSSLPQCCSASWRPSTGTSSSEKPPELTKFRYAINGRLASHISCLSSTGDGSNRLRLRLLGTLLPGVRGRAIGLRQAGSREKD